MLNPVVVFSTARANSPCGQGFAERIRVTRENK